MREILFRGKRKDTGEWVEGIYMPRPNSPNKPRYYIVLIDTAKWHEIISQTVCQYTGLTDKNGRKIFEGDIVKLPKCDNDIAVFVLRGCNYFLKGKRSNYELGSCDSECFEIIGNTFDNPELIGDQP